MAVTAVSAPAQALETGAPRSRPSGYLAGALLAGFLILIGLVALWYARRRRLAGKENPRAWRRTALGALLTLLVALAVASLLLVVRSSRERSPAERDLLWKSDGKVGAPNSETVAAKALPGLTDADLSAVNGSPRLRRLEIDHTEITDQALQHLDRFPNLVLLSVGHTQISDAGMVEIAKLNNLSELRIDNVPLHDSGLQQLAGLTQLEYLMLDETSITDAGLVHLRGMTRLQKLSLWRTRVSDAGIQHLRPLPALRHLSLDQTSVSDAGLPGILDFPVLRYLSVWQTNVTVGGANALRSKRPFLKINR